MSTGSGIAAAAWARSTAPRIPSSSGIVAVKVLADRFADDEAIGGRFTRQGLAVAD